MRAQARRDTAPELALRKELWAAGLRGYRVNWRLPLERPRTADVAFLTAQLAIFVHGCFWHGCSRHRSIPVANNEWWETKIARTKARDIETESHLRAIGWEVAQVWEHDDPRISACTISQMLKARRKTEHSVKGGP